MLHVLEAVAKSVSAGIFVVGINFSAGLLYPPLGVDTPLEALNRFVTWFTWALPQALEAR